MSRRYKNILKKNKTEGVIRRMNLTKEVLKNSTPIPLPLEYKDIDTEFRRWVTEDIEISYDGEKLPTFMLLSNQRFSEYLQSWKNVDEKRNLILNFKTITRENNPKSGTIIGQTKNIPGERTYLMKRVTAYDKNNRKYYIDYRVKQPFAVDLIYTVSIFTNKYELLNKFNQIINDKFKAINCYIRPNGHFIPMKINDISDESEYSIDNRQYYSQSYNITVMAYIMPQESFIVEERPEFKLMSVGVSSKINTYAEIEEISSDFLHIDVPYEYKKLKLTAHIDKDATSYKFNIDCDFSNRYVKTTNLRAFTLYINDIETNKDSNFELKNGDEIRISRIIKFNNEKDSEISFFGFDKNNTIKTGEENYYTQENV